ncbi:Imm26 family immunity protein [Bacteroides sp. UBA939]|uniref:Imm26 family immunity protein n=1 Tax=Bacteroides sp. UBA939 TaxID=1946092 RepID=UPI0025BCEE36|nr:Imm26 family immunity protein [Bacteroides sp. UBA939]
MVRQRITEGAILEISIENQYYVYAQILNKGRGYAFFDYKTKDKLINLEALDDAGILFIVAVYKIVIIQGRWLKVGKLPIRESLLVLPMEFIQDIFHPELFELYNPNTGEIIPTTRDKVVGLERAAVWDYNHVEDRIRDYYLGVPNVWLEHMKIR